jgi:Tryptophan-associated transmembrane protein (Trp_oprn_chp)
MDGRTEPVTGRYARWVSGRRGLALVVVACAAGAVLVLVASGRTWVVEVTPRPAPLPELRTGYTGGGLRPWLPALGWVALAGAGALLATRGIARRALGGLLVLAGAGIAAGAVTAEPGGWPVLAVVGGLVVAAAGVLTAGYGGRWPAMGARYERARTGGAPSAGSLWEALDRGEDPTAR